MAKKKKSKKAQAIADKRAASMAAGKTRDRSQEERRAAANDASSVANDKSGVENTSVNDGARTEEARHGA